MCFFFIFIFISSITLLGRTRGREDREEKEALREALDVELREVFEAEVSEDFLGGTDGLN